MLNRKSFILFTEWYDAICELSDKEQAQLFRNLFVYHMDNESEIKLSTLAVKLVWKLIHPHLSRNADKYDARSISSRENGKKGGRPKNLTKPNTKPNKPIETLYVNDNVNDNVNDKEKSKPKKSKKDFSVFSQNIIDLMISVKDLFPQSVMSELTENQKWEWLDELRKLHEIDKYEISEIKKVIEFARKSNFWSKNFLSILKLRKKNKEGIKYFTVFQEQAKENIEKPINRIHDTDY